jgi:hypothetical protein
MIAMLAVAAIEFFSPSGISAAPANGVAIGEAAAAAEMIEKAQRYRRYPRRRGRYYSYRPYYYTYRPYAPSGDETLHQLSEENQQRAQQNAGGLGH